MASEHAHRIRLQCARTPDLVRFRRCLTDTPDSNPMVAGSNPAGGATRFKIRSSTSLRFEKPSTGLVREHRIRLEVRDDRGLRGSPGRSTSTTLRRVLWLMISFGLEPWGDL